MSMRNASHSSYAVTELNRMADPREFAGEHYQYCHPAVTAEILAGQHAVRAWEYSQALRALEQWQQLPGPVAAPGLTAADIGGAGSQFYKTLLSGCARIDVVDPGWATPDGQRGLVHGLLDPGATAVSYPLAEWAGYRQNVAAYDAVFCLSVIEHITNPQPFVQQLISLVRPGGLLVLTCDAAEKHVDTYHFHWMRRWIAHPDVLDLLALALYNQGLRPLGAVPHFVYRGPVVYDYTVCSLAFRKDDS